MFTDTDLAKLDFPNQILVSVLILHLASDVLRYDIDLYFSNLIDNLLDIELNESVKRRDLLRDKTMLLKVTSNNGPSIFPINMVSR